MDKDTIQGAMAEVLAALGFEAMAREVRTEHDPDRLRRYARVCVKNAPEPQRAKLANLFRMHTPALY
jgi:hypothetical protein